MVILQELSLKQKLEILSDAAKYDVACTSSGVDRHGVAGKHTGVGSTSACGICHSFAADGRCISLLKILMSNECSFDCAYCVNRASNDVVRATFTPEEICTLTMEFYRRNYIEGLFLSSGVLRSPTETMVLMWEAIYKLRHEYHFYGYIHVKAIPGADPGVIEAMGYLADRMSVNLELPTGEGLRTLAPAKTRKNILGPMRQIQRGIGMRAPLLEDKSSEKLFSPLPKPQASLPEVIAKDVECVQTEGANAESALYRMEQSRSLGYQINGKPSQFAPAGQSTQMIIGATGESDYHIMAVSEALYRNYALKRVFYSAYIPLNEDTRLPALGTAPPLLREHRLYQADWLLRFYGFEVKELLNETHPNFNVYVDPKCDWALQHPEYFPVEVNKASYDMLLRVPGIGVRSAKRIVQARRSGALDFPQLKRIGVVLKRAHMFLTCKGRTMTPTSLDGKMRQQLLLRTEQTKNQKWENLAQGIRQMSLFDDFGLSDLSQSNGEADASGSDAQILLPNRTDWMATQLGQL